MDYIAPIKLSEQRFRNELKYVVPLNQANALMQELETHCDYDKHAGETGSYEIASLYYDTSDLRFYLDREESVPYRRKIRLRVYNKKGVSKALFIEIKERHKQQISKKRINLKSLDLLDSGISHHKIPLDLVVDHMEDTAEAREIRYLNERLHLEPVVIVRYKRTPLIPHFEDRMRLTLDTRVTGGGDNLSVYNEKQEKFVLGGDYGIFEVKSDHSVPMWLQSVMLRYNLSQTRFSKYCLAVDAAFGPNKPWLRSSEQVESRGHDDEIAQVIGQ